MRLYIIIVTLSTLLLFFINEISDLNNKTTLVNNDPIKIGIHSSKIDELNYFEERISLSLDIIAIHIHWGNENFLPKDIVEKAVLEEKTIFIFWNPMDYTKNNDEQEEFFYNKILSGDWDEYINLFIKDLKQYNTHFIISPFEEVNGYWVPWSGFNQNYGDIDLYKETFHYLRDKFRDKENVSFSWVINNTSVPNVDENQIEKYYPGSDYVDIIGVNGFNFDNPWISFDEIFIPVIEELQKYNKPIYITSFASAEGPQKSAWIDDFFASEIIREKRIWAWIWFHEDKEKDWRVWSDKNSEESFKKGLQK